LGAQHRRIGKLHSFGVGARDRRKRDGGSKGRGIWRYFVEYRMSQRARGKVAREGSTRKINSSEKKKKVNRNIFGESRRGA